MLAWLPTKLPEYGIISSQFKETNSTMLFRIKIFLFGVAQLKKTTMIVGRYGDEKRTNAGSDDVVKLNFNIF